MYDGCVSNSAAVPEFARVYYAVRTERAMPLDGPCGLLDEAQGSVFVKIPDAVSTVQILLRL